MHRFETAFAEHFLQATPCMPCPSSNLRIVVALWPHNSATYHTHAINCCVIWGANTSGWKTLRQSANCTALLAASGFEWSKDLKQCRKCCVFQRTCCNSEQSTQAPQLGHRKPLQGSRPTCSDKQENKFSCTLRTDFEALQLETPDLFHNYFEDVFNLKSSKWAGKALSGGVGAHLSHVQSNCFVLFNDLARAWWQQMKRIEKVCILGSMVLQIMLLSFHRSHWVMLNQNI